MGFERWFNKCFKRKWLFLYKKVNYKVIAIQGPGYDGGYYVAQFNYDII